MPYLQIDVPNRYPLAQKQRLAKRLGEIYAETMQANVKRISIAVRELVDGAIWRCTESGSLGRLVIRLLRHCPAFCRSVRDVCRDLIGVKERL